MSYPQAIEVARAAVAQGRVGLPWNVQADYLLAGTRPDDVGPLESLAPAAVEFLLAITGIPVIRVHVVGAARQVVLLLTHEHGLTSTLAVGWTGAVAESADQIVVHRYRISGSNGVLDIDATKPRVIVRTAAGVRRRWAGAESARDGGDAAVAAVLAAAVASLENGAPQDIRPEGSGSAKGTS